jgi:hypothetical protein
MIKGTRTVLTLPMLLLSAGALANSMDCGSKIILGDLRYGPTQYEVLKSCGPPVDTRGNSWIYEKSGGSLYILTFDGLGQLMSVDHRVQ